MTVVALAGEAMPLPDLNRSLRADNQPARKAGRLELGYPCKLGMDYDVKKGLYRSVDYDIT